VGRLGALVRDPLHLGDEYGRIVRWIEKGTFPA
jgi:hypothetical protein